MEGKSSTPSKAALPVVPNERTNIRGQLWGHGGGAIIEESVTSALNTRSWQSGRINEGMTPEQCHIVWCNSQQVEESAGWNRYSSSDLYDQQMDGQDEGSRRIYNNRGLTRRGGIAILRTLESSNREAPENREEEEFILGHNPKISIYPSSTPLTIPLPHDPVRPLKKPSLRPNSWAHFFTKFIVLGLLGLSSLTSTVKDLPNQDPTNI